MKNIDNVANRVSEGLNKGLLISRRSFLQFLTFIALSSSAVASAISCVTKKIPIKKPKRLYWFMLCGFRADPDLFNIYRWAEQGELPNIKKMMDNGSYGYSIPGFPSHTPTNFADLVTGSRPEVHGVSDGPMHVEGFPLAKPSVTGFSSTAKKVPAIWKTFDENNKNVFLLSMPGSTPPELEKGTTIRGRWGGWGADIYPLIFEPNQDISLRRKLGRAIRVFFLGLELTRFVNTQNASGWENAPASASPAKEAVLNGYENPINIYIYEKAVKGKKGYNRILFSQDKKTKLDDLAEGQWGEWHPLKLKFQNFEFDSNVKFKVIKVDKDGTFRIRALYDTLNKYIVAPSEVSEEIEKNVGPMVDFVDNWPAQFNLFYPQDKKTFVEEADMSLKWHKKMVSFVFDRYKPDVFIHDIYTPNQYLESRWWMGYLDPTSKKYKEVSDKTRDQLWKEVKEMYRGIDRILGEAIKKLGDDALIALSGDHGVVPLNKYVRLNNLLAKNGLLKFNINPDTGEPIIDWAASKAIYLKMAHIYIKPDGLAGNWERGSGPEYEALREKVIDILNGLKDEKGVKPVAKIVKWEKAKKELQLYEPRVGDLVIANKPGYGWFEEMTQDLEIFTDPPGSGYKQAILAEKVKGMWTPFIIMGPGVKKGHEIQKAHNHLFQYPTILELMGIKRPDFVQGKPLTEIIEKETSEA